MSLEISPFDKTLLSSTCIDSSCAQSANETNGVVGALLDATIGLISVEVKRLQKRQVMPLGKRCDEEWVHT